MKKFICLVLVFSFAGISWGSENMGGTTSLATQSQAEPDVFFIGSFGVDKTPTDAL